jgi:predicted lipid carrier protein YhbT
MPAAVAAALADVVRRLPAGPPSFALAEVLNHSWWPWVDAATRRQMEGQVVELVVQDLGLTCRLIARPHGLAAAPRAQTARVRLTADAGAYWRLIRGQEDPDTLFFNRRMVMEGDTEFGLLLKNTLDAVGPPRWR